MVAIPNCIAWSIQQIIYNSVVELKPQEFEMYDKNLCGKTKYLIHLNMEKRLESLEKISRILHILNQYYDKENYIWKEDKKEYKEMIEDYKKKIDEFVSWVRSLKGCSNEILNVHDWTY